MALEGGLFALNLGLAGWHCRLTVDAPGREAEVRNLFGGYALPEAGPAASEVFLSLRGDIPKIRWYQGGIPGDLTALLLSPEGKRFAALPDSVGPVYTDTVLGPAPALAISDGAMRVLQSDRWPLYLEFVLTWRMLCEGNFVSLHAAVCATTETALVLVGASGSGKSTLSAALSACGADFYGDENVYFHSGTGRLSVRPKTLGLRPGGLALLTAPPEGQWQDAKPNDPKCMVSLPLPQRPCPEEKARLYFLAGFAAEPLLQPAPAGETILRLLRGLGHGDPSVSARLDAASEIAARYPAWKLTLGRPEDTAKQLIAHVRGT